MLLCWTPADDEGPRLFTTKGATAGRVGPDHPRGPGDREIRQNVGMVSINEGKVRHDVTQMTADHVVHRENDGTMS